MITSETMGCVGTCDCNAMANVTCWRGGRATSRVEVHVHERMQAAFAEPEGTTTMRFSRIGVLSVNARNARVP